ncbi:unnamed protein product [Victoria cruziana]
MSWLSNSMEPAIAEGVLFLDSAKEIWDSLVEIYGGGQNLARVYMLQQEINKASKGARPFHLYLSSLKGMWDEIAQHRPLSSDIEVLWQRNEEDKAFKLLAGLRHDYEHIYSRILMIFLLLSFNNICAIIQRE